MVGTTLANALWAATIKPGDDIYLFNFEARRLYGPYLAVSGADCHDPSAWGGGFPLQVKTSKTALTRRVKDCSSNAPAILSKRRPTGEIGRWRKELLTWQQENGTVV
jgi:Development and cell death domain